MLHQPNDRANFKTIIENYLFPMFPGMRFDNGRQPQKAPRSSNLVADISGKVGFKLKPRPGPGYMYVVRRSQKFSPAERQVVETFVEEMVKLLDVWDQPYREELAGVFLARVVARSAYSAVNATLVTEIINVFTEWSQLTYEGQRIVCSVWVQTATSNAHGPSFREAVKHDFIKVISNGQDTLLCCDDTGEITGHEPLSGARLMETYAPLRFIPVAEWTKDHDGVAIVLSQKGEIIVFAQGAMSFAKRRGKWRYFAHETAIGQLGNKKPGNLATKRPLRIAVYLTALDVSFSRGGGCIGLQNRSLPGNAPALPVASGDLLASGTSVKVGVLKTLVGGRKFQELHRHLRQELVSIDGATVVKGDGEILAAGAILNVPSGSSGGGRTAAARRISRRGIGIKVSNDGEILVFADGRKTPILQFG